MSNSVITVDKIYKNFKLPHEKAGSIKNVVVGFMRRRRGYEIQKVLRNVSFNVEDGEFFGIVGRNGSGKSTLLKMLAGIYEPTSGNIAVKGSLIPFIELGVGFNPELTGRENVYLNGALLGFSRSEVALMYDDIVKFSEIERFMDQKLKNYSSGMQVRLAFSIAIKAKADILLLDEVLAVGDAAFQKKCYDYFMDLKKDKKTVVLVTHDMGAIRQYCDRAIMIEKGRIVASGEPEKVAQSYQRLFVDKNTKTSTDIDVKKADRWGSGQVRVVKVTADVKDKQIILTSTYKARKDTPSPIFGFSIYNQAGTNILESNTRKEKIKTKQLKKGEEVKYTWVLPNIFANGNYDVSFAVCDQSITDYYDWLNHALNFRIDKDTVSNGIINPEIKVDYKVKELNNV